MGVFEGRDVQSKDYRLERYDACVVADNVCV